MINQQHTLLLFLLLLAACENSVTNTNESDGCSNILFQELDIKSFPYKIAKLVPLETTGNNYLSDNIKVKFTPDFIFIFDEEIRDAVHQFDYMGQYLGEIISTGEGPGKVSRIYDFTVSEMGVELLVGKGSYSEVVVISIPDKKVIEMRQLDVIGFSFEKINSHYYVYSSYNYPLAQYRLSKIDSEGNTIVGFLKNDYSGKMVPMIERNLYRMDETVLLVESFNNRVYELRDEQLKCKFILDFGSYNFSADLLERDIMQTFEQLNADGFFSILHHFENKAISLTGVHFQRANEGQSYHLITYQNSNKPIKNKLEEGWGDIFKYPVATTDSGEIVFSAHPLNLIRNADKFNGNKVVAEALNELENHDNPILVYSDLQLSTKSNTP
ncbi:MAG: 6-bladed beta-propeller [Lunatimonas sp.]|nr:6-bladed beta-propeller [Lunatimonas sp.]